MKTEGLEKAIKAKADEPEKAEQHGGIQNWPIAIAIGVGIFAIVLISFLSFRGAGTREEIYSPCKATLQVVDQTVRISGWGGYGENGCPVSYELAGSYLMDNMGRMWAIKPHRIDVFREGEQKVELDPLFAFEKNTPKPLQKRYPRY